MRPTITKKALTQNENWKKWADVLTNLEITVLGVTLTGDNSSLYQNLFLPNLVGYWNWNKLRIDLWINPSLYAFKTYLNRAFGCTCWLFICTYRNLHTCVNNSVVFFTIYEIPLRFSMNFTWNHFSHILK